ncbi:MAG: iron-sulfur cluster assembly scaffold protein [candidate division WOR-3 bacterium]
MPGKSTDRTDEEWVAELQDRVIKDMEKVYSPKVMELWKSPQNAGSLDHPDGYGQVTGPCGDTMQVWLRVHEDVITEATFWTDGCGLLVGSSRTTAQLEQRAVVETASPSTEDIRNIWHQLEEQEQQHAKSN